MAPSPLPPDHVLIVDEDPVVLNLLRHTLRTGGFISTAVATGSAALLTLCAQRERIDWLVTPIALRGLVDGWILADEYHQYHPDWPALFITGQALRSGGSPVGTLVLPPFAPLRMLEALKALSSPERAVAMALQRVAQPSPHPHTANVLQDLNETKCYSLYESRVRFVSAAPHAPVVSAVSASRPPSRPKHRGCPADVRGRSRRDGDHRGRQSGLAVFRPVQSGG